MKRLRRRCKAVAAVMCAMTLLLSACGSEDGGKDMPDTAAFENQDDEAVPDSCGGSGESPDEGSSEKKQADVSESGEDRESSVQTASGSQGSDVRISDEEETQGSAEIAGEPSLEDYNWQDRYVAVGAVISLNLPTELFGLSYSSSDEEKVTVDAAGNVTGIAPGSAVISVNSGEGEKTFRVYATMPEISLTQITKIAGNKVQLNILGTNGETEWYTDNPAVAVVDEKGLVTALSTGSGQSTSIHAKVDGTELTCKISVEPIPRLESAYKLFAFSEGTAVRQYNSYISICSNANKCVTYTEDEYQRLSSYSGSNSKEEYPDPEVQEVLDIAEVDYTSGLTFPLYETYYQSKLIGSTTIDEYTHSEIYLVGSSQDAEVLTISNQKLQVSYEACEGYGIISVYYDVRDYAIGLVKIKVDGYEYAFAVRTRGRAPDKEGQVPKADIVEELVHDDNLVFSTDISTTSLYRDSRAFIPSEWVSSLGEKMFSAAEDKAISTAVDLLFKIIF